MTSAPDRLIDPDEIVLEVAEARLLLDYPIEVPALRTVRANQAAGFTRHDLMRVILDTYQAVYDTER